MIILTRLLVTFVMLVPCFSMESPDLPKEFEITSTRSKFRFREVDLEHLNTTDLQKFIDHTQDYDALNQKYGPLIAAAFSVAGIFNPQIAYDYMVVNLKNAKQSNPKFFSRLWFVEDLKDDGAFVGHFSLSTLRLVVPTSLQSSSGGKLKDGLELSVSLGRSYKGLKVVSSLVLPLLSKLQSVQEFAHKTLAITTLPTNAPVLQLANKHHFERIGHVRRGFTLPIFDLLLTDPTEFVLFTRKLG